MLRGRDVGRSDVTRHFSGLVVMHAIGCSVQAAISATIEAVRRRRATAVGLRDDVTTQRPATATTAAAARPPAAVQRRAPTTICHAIVDAVIGQATIGVDQADVVAVQEGCACCGHSWRYHWRQFTRSSSISLVKFMPIGQPIQGRQTVGRATWSAAVLAAAAIRVSCGCQGGATTEGGRAAAAAREVVLLDLVVASYPGRAAEGAEGSAASQVPPAASVGGTVGVQAPVAVAVHCDVMRVALSDVSHMQ